MLARCYIRDADDFYNVIQLLFRIVVFLLPFASFRVLYRAEHFARAVCSGPANVNDPPMPPRSGLTRVTSVFDHPILFGAFTGSILALVHLVLGYQEELLSAFFQDRDRRSNVVLSLSSGAADRPSRPGASFCLERLIRSDQVPVEILDRAFAFDHSSD